MTADRRTIALIHGLWMTVTQAGCEEVADNALLWALCHARNRGVSESKSEVAA